jgi:glucose-6-phosphate 1-dehydrogenase
MSTETKIAPKGAKTVTKVLRGRQAPPTTLVIFGADGDLTKRLVVPALYNLVQARELPERCKDCSIPGRIVPNDFPNYAAGSAGPEAADRLLARDGRAWLPIRAEHPHTAIRP